MYARLREIGRECVHERLDGMLAGYNRIEVDPLLTIRQYPFRETRQQASHDDTRFARSAWSNHRQESRTWHAGSFQAKDIPQCCHHLINECLPPKEIGGLVLSK